ncbi:MAG: type II toxin-antitoxin system VapB family antitoxin [Sphingopyxis sp.]|nr:type II toxin-antitoxin system VapB family antitoxin [Sphingopyxis sp.]
MGLSIKNDETERLVREYAQEQGLSMTEAIRHAILQVRNSQRATKMADAARRKQAIDDIVDSFAKLPVIDSSVNADEWMYDENGLPH